jgi:hypothetical protein
MPSDLILGRPVRAERTHQIKNPKLGSDSVGKAAADLDPVEWKILQVGRLAGAEIVAMRTRRSLIRRRMAQAAGPSPR